MTSEAKHHPMHDIVAPCPVEGKASPDTKQLIEDQVLEAMELLGVAYKPSAYDAACKVLYHYGRASISSSLR